MSSKDKIFIPYNEGLAIAHGVGWNPYKHITIDADEIKLCQKDIGITIDISNEIISKIESIEINGFKFMKEEVT